MEDIEETLPNIILPFTIDDTFIIPIDKEEEYAEDDNYEKEDNTLEEKEDEEEDEIGLTKLDVLSVRDFPYTEGQITALRGIAEEYKLWTINGHQQTFLLLQGFAGSGKTSIIETMVKYIEFFPVIHREIILLAPTNRAVAVIKSKVGEENAASTLHKFIYPPPERDKDTGKTVWKIMENNELITKDMIMFIDEYSMINLDLFNDFKKRIANCLVVFIGDPFQLEAIGNPALIEQEVKCSWLLTEIKRTTNTILNLATEVRTRKLNVSYHKSTNDIIIIKKNQAIETAVLIFDVNSEVHNSNFAIVCATNKTRLSMTFFIRESLFGHECMPLYLNEPVICINNNFVFVNGDLLRVETLETLQYIILVDSEEVEHKVMLCIINDTATIFIPNCEKASISTYLFGNNNLNSLIRDEYKHFFLEPINVSNIGMGARIRYLNQFNKNVAIMTYAYALSAHKLQGSELDAILLYQDYCSENWSSARWFYTALTRAVSKVYLINTKYQTLI